MTIHSLHPLFQSLAAAVSEQSLRSRFMDGVSESFGVQRWGIYLLGDENYAESIDVQGVSDDFVDRYQRFGKSVDPVLDYVIKARRERINKYRNWNRVVDYSKLCQTSFEADVQKVRSFCSNGNGGKIKRFILNIFNSLLISPSLDRIGNNGDEIFSSFSRKLKIERCSYEITLAS